MKGIEVKTLLVGLFLASAFAVSDRVRLLEGPKAVAHSITAPGQYLVYSVKSNLNNWFSFLTFWKSGEARIKNLEFKVLELTVAKNKVDGLEKENAELRKQLAVSAKTPVRQREQIPALVLGLSRYLEIGAGGNQGIIMGQTVIYGDNLIGRIVKVSNSIAYVQLPRDSESKIAVRAGSARGLVKGEFNSVIKISQVAQNEEIRTDDLVVTSGEGGNYFPELVVGKVGKISTDNTGLFKEAEVTPLVDVGQLTMVFVLIN